MQALGAYGFRGFYERKAHFLQSVPYALKNLCWLLEYAQMPIALPALMSAFKSMVISVKLQAIAGEAPHRSQLTIAEKPQAAVPEDKDLIVHVYSFSFHQGGPAKDESGNGGGFVFDCRGIPNPGREERFKALTGKDAAIFCQCAGHGGCQRERLSAPRV
jgi:hypothetical protein